MAPRFRTTPFAARALYPPVTTTASKATGPGARVRSATAVAFAVTRTVIGCDREKPMTRARTVYAPTGTFGNT